MSAELRTAMEDRRKAGLVRRVDSGELSLFTYTQKCVYGGEWDDVTMQARGIVFRGNHVVARPFPKFFNYGERSVELPDEPFEVFEKMDGSLGIVFHDGTRWRVATKGSFDSEQAKWAEQWLADRFPKMFSPYTYLFEIIYPENRIVVRYEKAYCVLLAIAQTRLGRELPFDELVGEAGHLDVPLVRRLSGFGSVAELVDTAKMLDANSEGFVVRFQSGYRVKVKGDAYMRIHRALSRVTPLGVWELMAAGDDLAVFRQGLTEECWGDFDDIAGRIGAMVADCRRVIEDEVSIRDGLDDKHVGLSLDRMPEVARKLIFVARRNPRWFDDDAKARASLFRHIRPTGNRLPGYEPSRMMLRLNADE